MECLNQQFDKISPFAEINTNDTFREDNQRAIKDESASAADGVHDKKFENNVSS